MDALKPLAPIVIAGATAASGHVCSGLMRHCSQALTYLPIVFSGVVIVGVFWLAFRDKLSVGVGIAALTLGIVGNLGMGAFC
jgi:hypothetical protein